MGIPADKPIIRPSCSLCSPKFISATSDLKLRNPDYTIGYSSRFYSVFLLPEKYLLFEGFYFFSPCDFENMRKRNNI